MDQQPSPSPPPSINGPSGASVVATEWALLGAAAVLISARLYLRLNITRRRLTHSDAFICLAWIAAAAYNAFDILYLALGVMEPHVDGALSNFQRDPETDAQTLQTIQMVSTVARRSDAAAMETTEA